MSRVALDPRAAELLSLGAQSAAPPLESLPIGTVRDQVNASLPALGLPLEAVAEVVDLVIPAVDGGMAVPSRLFRPVTADGVPQAGIALFHGGGWACCGLVTHDTLARYLANATGAAVLSVDYRLAPEHKFPAAFDDCVQSVRWLTSGGCPGIDSSRIAIAGDSAGGNLAAAVARELSPDQNLRHQLLIYPVLDSVNRRDSHDAYGKGYFLDTTTMQWFVELYARSPDDRADPRFSPLLASSLAGMPSTTLLVAGYDVNRDEALVYGRRLLEAGVECRVHLYEHLPHGFASMAGFIEAGRAALSDGAQALRRALG